MNGLMNIQIRVLSANARKQIRELEAEIAMLRREVNSADSAMNGMGQGGIRGITRWGNQVQWAGRQLQYNFTLPILLAGGAAAKFALDNEKAMTRVIKVYGDGSEASNRLAKTEIPALGRAFEALSSKFGIAQADAINIAADWAAAGASGIALAKSVELTMQTMVLGEIEATAATQALIAIQAQYGFGVKELSKTIDTLNMVENQTGISMQGLIEGFARAAGVARSAGIDVEHLAAMMAALTPAAGSAANAGNALKTIISRLLSPTGEAAEVMALMGINTKELAWQSLNGTQRLEAMAKSFDKLGGAQKAVVSTVIASRWQINRFDVLMRDMINTNGYYQKSLQATSDAQANFNQKVKELNAVLDSNPQKLKQIWVILQNAMAQVIQPMIPIILLLAAQVARLAEWFQSLNPEVQKFALFSLLVLAAIGPVARYIGSVAVLLGVMREALAWAGRGVLFLAGGLTWLYKGPLKLAALGVAAFSRVGAMFAMAMATVPATASRAWAAVLASTAVLRNLGPMILGAISWPITAAVVGVVALLIAFRDRLGGIWDTIVEYASKAFWLLPQSVRDAMFAVVTVVQKAALKVYEWFSYLNPFARHSPSLVEQVTAGMAVIKKQYASVGNVGAIFSKAARDLKAYKDAIAALGGGEFSDEKNNVAKYIPKALPLFKALLSDLNSLNNVLAVQEARMNAQQAVVDRWSRALDAANATLDVEQDKLDKLQANLDKLTEAYNAHEQAMQAYADAPLVGMGEMEDKIFANEQAQKRLRLEMLRWEEVNGSIEDVQNNMALLAGDIERLRGEADSLRAAGAGSDILGPINEQVAAMQRAYDAMGDQIENSPVNEMQKQLEELQRQGEILDLEKSLTFDEAIRNIDKLVNAQKELTYNEIIAGIQAEKAAMAELQPQIDAATAAVERQKAAVDAAKAARDAVQATYDAENAKLNRLKDDYDQTADLVRDVESALREMGSAAQAAGEKAADAARKAKEAYMSPGARNFLDSAGADFPDVGQNAKIGREGSMADQSKLIDEFTKGLNDEIQKKFGEFDMFGPIKRKWNEFTGWLQDNVWDKMGGVEEAFTSTLTKIGDWLDSSGVADKAASIWTGFVDGVKGAWDWGKKIYDLFKDDLQKIWDSLVESGSKIWDEIGPELEKFKDLVPGISKLFSWLWTVLKLVGAFMAGQFLFVLKRVSSIVSNVVGPAFDMVIQIVKNIIRTFRGLLEFLVGIFTGDLGLAIEGIKDMIGGLWDGIWAIIEGTGKMILGVVKGLVEGVADFFWWLYDIVVGHSIVPDMVRDIIAWFASLPGKAWNALISLKDKVVDVAKQAWTAMKNKSIELWNGVITWIKGRAQNAYDNFINLKTKLTDAAKQAWDSFLAKSKEIFSTIVTWISQRPQVAYDNLKTIITKLGDLGRAAFKAFMDKAKEIIDGRNGFFTWIGGIPGKVGKILGTVGSTVANAIKSAWNSAAGWINKNGIGAVNKVTSRFGFNLSQLPTFQGGGVIPGKISKRDNTIIAARTGEGVIVPELVAALGGARGLNRANRAAASGNVNALRNMGIEGYADGGIIGKVTGWLSKGAGHALGSIIGAMKSPVRSLIPGQPFAEDWLVGQLQGWQDAAKKWGEAKEAMGAGVLPGTGYQWQIKAVKNRFPDAVITSSFRPGAITALGNKSMHGIGRAIDIAPRNDIFDWIRGTYGKNTKQLFYSPRDGKTILNGRDWNMDAVTKAGHWDHIHWGYDKGGILPPGLTLAQNNTGKNEFTLTNGDFQRLSNVVSLLDRMTQKRTVAGAPGGSPVSRMAATLATVESRLRSANATERQSGGGGDTFNFNGDLSFPNITSGDDVAELIDNLKGLAG